MKAFLHAIILLCFLAGSGHTRAHMSDLSTPEKNDVVYSDTITDIDGNTYKTVIIGEQEWTTSNLRTTRYKDGSEIDTGLSNYRWSIATEGAYVIFNHEHPNAFGIDSEEEMADIYGKLYNWYAVADERGLCPEGWRTPSHDDWTQLEQAVCEALGNDNCDTKFPFDTTTRDWRGTNEGDALKSCRQHNSPLGDDCDTTEHPVWFDPQPDSDNYGFDEFGFSAIPGGDRHHTYSEGTDFIGFFSIFWTSTEQTNSEGWGRAMRHSNGEITRQPVTKNYGSAVRCVRDVEADTHIIQSSAGNNGDIEPEGDVEVNDGAEQVFHISPDSGFVIDSLIIDNDAVDLEENDNWDAEESTYTFYEVSQDHSIEVTFKEDATSIFEGAQPNDLSVYPNPASDVLYLDNLGDPSAELKASIISIEGKVIKSRQLNLQGQSQAQLNIQDIEEGVYFLLLESEKGRISVPIVIQR